MKIFLLLPQLYYHRASKKTNHAQELNWREAPQVGKKGTSAFCVMTLLLYIIISSPQQTRCHFWLPSTRAVQFGLSLSHLSTPLGTCLNPVSTSVLGERQRSCTGLDPWCFVCWCWYETIVFWCKWTAGTPRAIPHSWGGGRLVFFLMGHLYLQTRYTCTLSVILPNDSEIATIICSMSKRKCLKLREITYHTAHSKSHSKEGWSQAWDSGGQAYP